MSFLTDYGPRNQTKPVPGNTASADDSSPCFHFSSETSFQSFQLMNNFQGLGNHVRPPDRKSPRPLKFTTFVLLSKFSVAQCISVILHYLDMVEILIGISSSCSLQTFFNVFFFYPSGTGQARQGCQLIVDLNFSQE